MQVLSLEWEHPLGEDMATHPSILAWRIPCTEEPGRLQSIALQRVRHNSNNTIINNREYILIMYNERDILTVFVIKNLNPN